MEEIRNAGIPEHLLRESGPPLAPKNQMGKNEFMTLLMTQIQHQDPLKPMEHTEFISQLAQFSTLEQLTGIEKGIQNLQSGAGDQAKLQALGMIGKQVQANGNQVELEEGKPMNIPFAFEGETRPVRAVIYDTSGKLVRTIDLASRGSSVRDFIWDGKNDEGEVQVPGKYTFSVLGLTQDGKVQEVGSDIKGKVKGVVVEGALPTLLVETPSGERRIEMNQIRQVAREEAGAVPVAGPGVPQIQALAQALPVEVAAEDSEMESWRPREQVFGLEPNPRL